MPTEFHNMLVSEMPRLRGYAIAICRNRALADDLLQDTALKAWRAQDQFALGTNFKAWLYRIFRNEFISFCRNAKRAPSNFEEIPPELLGRESNQDTIVLTRQILDAVNKLSLLRREVLLLSCAHEFAYNEIAEALQISVGTVKSRLFRARAEMRTLLAEEKALATDEINGATPLMVSHREGLGADLPISLRHVRARS